MTIKKNSNVSSSEVLSLKKWARENFVSMKDRNPAWHPIILEEMQLIEMEMYRNRDPFKMQRFVPSASSKISQTIGLHAPHEKITGPRILESERVSSENYVG